MNLVQLTSTREIIHKLLFIFHFVLQVIACFSFCFTSYLSFFVLFHKILFVFSQALGSFLDGNHGMLSIRFVYIQHIVEGMTFSLPHIFPNPCFSVYLWKESYIVHTYDFILFHVLQLTFWKLWFQVEQDGNNYFFDSYIGYFINFKFHCFNMCL